MALLASLVACWEQEAPAADFSRAKKIYVPATKIDRRVDYHALREREAASYAQDTSGVPAPVYVPSSPPPKPGKNGLVPPPPPVAPSILPQGHPAAVVPPPPPARPLTAARSSKPPAARASAATAHATKPQEPLAGGIRAKAEELIKQGKLEEADAVLRSAWKSSPKNTLIARDLTDLSLKRAKRFLGEKDLESAARAAREAVFVSPSDAAATSLLDDVLRQSGVNPADPAERVRLGDLLASQSRDTAATVEYRQALKLRPDARAHVGLGNLAMRANKKSQAKQEYTKALEVDPNSAVAHRNMGLLRLADGDIVGANSDLSRAVILDPADHVAGNALVSLWKKQVSTAPADVNSRLGLARAYQLTGDLKNAQSEYRQVVRLDPDHPNLPAARQSFKLALARQEAQRHLQAARTLDSQGAAAPALDKVNEALGLDPSNPDIRLYQGQLLEKLGRAAQARDAYMNVLRDDPYNIAAAQRLKELAGTSTPPVVLAPQQGMFPPLAEAPPLPTLASPTPDHVTALSNFAASIRNHALSEKKRVENIEKEARSLLDQIPHRPIESAGTPLLMAGATGTTAASASAPPASGGFAPAAFMAGSAPLSFSPQLGSSQGTGQPVSSAPSSPGASFAAPDGAVQPAFANTPFSTAPPLSAGNQPSTPSRQDASQPATGLLRGPMATGVAPPLGWSAPQTLPQPAPAFQQPLLSAPPTAAAPARTLQSGAEIGSFQPQATAIYPPGPQAAYGPQAPANAAPVALGPYPPQSTQPLPLTAPGGAPPMGAPGQQGSLVPVRSNGPGSVRLELEGFTPTARDIELKVVLRNGRSEPLPLPSRLTGVMRGNGIPDTKVKVSFPGRQVPAYGEIHGMVQIPAREIDPSADLVLPNLLPQGSPDRDVHLTIPVSWR